MVNEMIDVAPLSRTYKLDPAIVARLEETARREDRTMTAIVERALRLYFAAAGQDIPPAPGNGKTDK